jgi:alanine or glycine:cation symporter, AGCS family
MACLLLLLLILPFGSVISAQDPLGEGQEQISPSATAEDSAEGDADPPSPLDGAELLETGAERRMIEPDVVRRRPTLHSRIDQGFATVVGYMEQVLFYRIAAKQREYVEFDEREYYFRPADTDEPFAALDPSNRESQLTPQDVTARQALDVIISGEDGQPIQRGTLDGRPVEFVVVQTYRAKFIWERGKFRRQLPRLQQLADDDAEVDVLSEEQVVEAAAAGRLSLDPERLEAGDPDPFRKSEPHGGIPFVVLWLASGATFFTIYMRGYNIWGFRHAIYVVRGHYDDPNEPGEVSHFQALSSALSATVGLGNIAGVTIAMATGGPGAFFWMMFCGLLGMTSKFVECTLGVKYRRVNEDGTVLGGPMQYLHHGLREMGLPRLGLVLSMIFTVMCILASFGGGNMFQANQSGQQMLAMLQMHDQDRLEKVNEGIRSAAESENYGELEQLQQQRAEIRQRLDRFRVWFLPVYGLVLAFMVGIVIVGGIKRIGAAAEKVVPSMCVVYMLACLFVIFSHLGAVPGLVWQIFSEAFSPQAFGGGLLGVLVIGVQRAAFSNEAGVGSAAIAHSAARTDEPIREGTVALMEPFIDTVVVCSLTALVILITGAWQNEEWIVNQGLEGAALTSKAFEQELPWFPYVLTVAVVLFAYSTLISWSYYGERCWAHLFGLRSTIVYRILFIIAAFVGAIVNLGAVLDFSDMMILSMAFPNIFGLLLLAPQVRRDLLDYWRRLESGEMTPDR